MPGLGESTPLRRLCIAHGTTRARLAERAGLNRRTIYNIEEGNEPQEATILKIAEALGVEPLYVLDVLAGRTEPDSRRTVAA